MTELFSAGLCQKIKRHQQLGCEGTHAEMVGAQHEDGGCWVQLRDFKAYAQLLSRFVVVWGGRGYKTKFVMDVISDQNICLGIKIEDSTKVAGCQTW